LIVHRPVSHWYTFLERLGLVPDLIVCRSSFFPRSINSYHYPGGDLICCRVVVMSLTDSGTPCRNDSANWLSWYPSCICVSI
jgi:hypothetical protein